MSALSLIGYWRAEADSTSDYPDPHDWVDREWDEDERYATWFYFASGTLFRTYMGYSPCRICGVDNGAAEYTDGTYVWPEGLAHYIYDHAVRLPEDLVRHAKDRLDTLEDSGVASDWWVGATAKE